MMEPVLHCDELPWPVIAGPWLAADQIQLERSHLFHVFDPVVYFNSRTWLRSSPGWNNTPGNRHRS